MQDLVCVGWQRDAGGLLGMLLNGIILSGSAAEIAPIREHVTPAALLLTSGHRSSHTRD